MLKKTTLLVMLAVLAGRLYAAAPYINAAVADSEFYKISSADMDRIRTLKILFGSRSFGYNLRGGLTSLEAGNAMYEIINDDYANYDVFNNGGNVDAVPADAFDTDNFVHFMCTASPWSQRNYEFEELVQNYPYNFSDDINVAMLYYHGGDMSAFSVYSAKFDSMQAQYPHITFVYVTGGYEASDKTSHNASSAAFGAAVRAKYQGVAPLYDLARILNDDDRCGDQYCDEYSTDPAGVHPNTDFIQQRMGKGFLVMLYKLFIEADDPCTSEMLATPTGLSGTGTSLYSLRLTWTAANSACNIDRFLIRRDGTIIGESFGDGFNDTGLEENVAYDYEVATVGTAGDTSDFTAPVTVRTNNDSVAPGIVAVPTTIVATQVVVQFDEDLDTVSATTAANYTVDGGVSVLGASLSESYEVTLTVTTLTENTDYILTVTGVKDLSVNENATAGIQETFRYSSMTVDEDYAAYWAFENSLDDSSVNNTSASWTGTAAYEALGLKGACLTMDGSDSCGYVQIADNGIMDGQPAFTIAMWAKKDDAATGGRLLHKHVSYFLNISETGVNGYFFNIGGVRLNYSATADIGDTDWHHYALTHDGDTARVLVDGARVWSGALEDSLENTTRTTYVGRDPWGVAFAGDIDEIRVYHWALEPSELNQLITGAAVNRDSLAVRALLDANGDSRTVDGTATFDSSGRVTALNIQTDVGGNIAGITSHIGQLTELTLLHVYGPADHDHATPHLTSVDPAIGNCAKLTELLLNDNDLADLPLAITGLTNLSVLSVGNNLLCGLDDTLKTWLDTADPDWEGTQECTALDQLTVDGGQLTSGLAIQQKAGRVVINGLADSGPMQIDIHALDGSRVYTIQNVIGDKAVWHTDGFGSGMYFVKVRDGLRQETFRVMVVQ